MPRWGFAGAGGSATRGYCQLPSDRQLKIDANSGPSVLAAGFEDAGRRPVSRATDPPRLAINNLLIGVGSSTANC